MIDGRTGVLFDRPTVDDLCAAIEHLDSMTWSTTSIRAHAESFDVPVFRRRFRELFERLGVDRSLYLD